MAKEKVTNSEPIKDEKKEQETITAPEEKTPVITEEDFKAQVEDVLNQLIGATPKEVETEVKELLDAVKATGKVSFQSKEKVKETLEIAKELKKIRFDKINFVVNPNRSIVVIDDGLSVPPYTIVYLPRTIGNEKRLEALRKSPRFINAIRSRLLLGFEDLTPEDFSKLHKALKMKALEGKNVLEIAEKKGISGATDLKTLIQRDKKIEEYFKKMMEDIRRKTGTDQLQGRVTGYTI